MNHHVGIDLSLEASSVCVVDGSGNIACGALKESLNLAQPCRKAGAPIRKIT